MMKFHSCWHYIFTDYPYMALKGMGFNIEPISDNMNNGFKCNTVFFQKNSFLQELQFRELLDEVDFMNFQRQKKDRRESVHDLLRPGVYFQHDTLNEEFVLDGLEVYIGKADAIASASGADAKLPSAPVNEKLKIVGLLWNLSENDLEYFCRRANLKVENNKIKISDDFNIFLGDKNSNLYSDFEARKDFPFWSVIIQTPSLSQFDESKFSDEMQQIQWLNQKAILIKNHITHWDMILTESK